TLPLVVQVSGNEDETVPGSRRESALGTEIHGWTDHCPTVGSSRGGALRVVRAGGTGDCRCGDIGIGGGTDGICLPPSSSLVEAGIPASGDPSNRGLPPARGTAG